MICHTYCWKAKSVNAILLVIIGSFITSSCGNYLSPKAIKNIEENLSISLDVKNKEIKQGQNFESDLLIINNSNHDILIRNPGSNFYINGKLSYVNDFYYVDSLNTKSTFKLKELTIISRRAFVRVKSDEVYTYPLNQTFLLQILEKGNHSINLRKEIILMKNTSVTSNNWSKSSKIMLEAKENLKVQ